MRHHWIEAATGHSSKQFAKGGRRTGHHPFKRGWVAVAVEQALGDLGSRTMPNAVSVILAARRSSEIASALFRSKSLAICVLKRRSLLLCDLLRTSYRLNNGSTVSCSRRRTQMEEGDLNLFSSMVEFRKFIVDRNPCADVVVTLKPCWFRVECFEGIRVTRGTFVDSTMRTALNPGANNVFREGEGGKDCFAQVTVLDYKTAKAAR
ncbi:hypothetical protein PI124_g11188 [Phytophthora idaei]|nr:hypothetical protein PI124_g11188 [Phytophthora idaei]